MSMRPSARFGFVLRLAGVPALALLGAAAAVCIPPAHAGLVPTLPTVTIPIPSLPVTLPTVPGLPIVTTGTTTTAPGATTTTTSSTPGSTTSTSTSPGTESGGGGRNGSSEGGTDAIASVAGAIRLASGAISIPVASVRAPAVLVIDRVTVSPSRIGARGQRFRVVARVSDSRGYRVRGASIGVGSAPGGRIKPVRVHTTSVDGTVTLQLTTTSRLPLRKGSKLILVVRAYEASPTPGAAKSIRRVVSLPIRPR